MGLNLFSKKKLPLQIKYGKYCEKEKLPLLIKYGKYCEKEKLALLIKYAKYCEKEEYLKINMQSIVRKRST